MTLPHDILYNSKITDQKNQKVILYSELKIEFKTNVFV